MNATSWRLAAAVTALLAGSAGLSAEVHPPGSTAAATPDTVFVAPPTGERATDRASILAALERVRPGGIVQFAGGTYLTGEIIHVSVPRVSLLGHSEGTTLRGCDPAEYAEDPLAEPLPDGLPWPYVGCNGLQLTGGHQTVHGLTFEYAWHGIILGMRPPMGGWTAEPEHARAGGYLIEGNTFRNSTNGIRTVGEWTEPAVIRGNTFVNTYHAVAVNGMTTHVLENDISVPEPDRVPIVGYPGSAIAVSSPPWAESCDRNVIAGNRIEGHPDGIEVIGFRPKARCRHNEIRDNTIVIRRVRLFAPQPWIRMDDESDLSVVGVPLVLGNDTDPADFGGASGGFEHNLIEGNRIIGAEGLAIEIRHASRNRIVNNTVTGVLRREPFPGNTLGHDARQWREANGAGIWISPGSDENEILGNTFEDIASDAIVLEGDRNRIEAHIPGDAVRDLGSGNRVSVRAGDRNPTERLVFGSFRPANWDIYYFAEPGAEPRRLTDHPSLDYDPALSPDGRWVVFTSERLGRPTLFALDLHRPGPPSRQLIESDVMEDQATFSPDGRTLFFVSTRDGSADVYSISFDPERTRPIADAINLTGDPAGAFRPVISPDGRRLAFSSDRDHPPHGPAVARQRGGDLYLMELESGALRRLTRTEPGGWSGSPTWSADGATIYFYRAEGPFGNRRFGLWSVPAAGGEPRLLFADTLAILSPAIAPDGRIAFAMGIPFSPAPSAAAPRFGIWSVLPDGSGLRLESDTALSFAAPSFALRAGGMVAHGPGRADLERPQSGVAQLMGGPGPVLTPGAPWRRVLPDRDVELYPVREFLAAALPSGDAMVRALPPGPRLVVSDLEGNDAREVVDLGLSRSPIMALNAVAVSPDGEWLVYMNGPMFGEPDEGVDLWKVRMDGTGGVNLTRDSPANDGFPSFSPDGSWLAFRSGRTGTFDVFRMDADGGGVRNLTAHPARDIFPVVSPRGDLIAFLSNRDHPGTHLFEIYLMSLQPDGSAGTVHRITHGGAQNGHPYFSPDGKWLVFTSEMGGINDEEPLVRSFVFGPQMYGELYAYRIADGLLVRITHDKWEDGFPSWVRGPAGRMQSSP
jgi:Tol biopolymer transport system component